MSSGGIQCTHSFYLKFFHVLLAAGTITVPEVDLLMIDEFGDITGLTLEIFRLLKAKKKIAVGDPLQNIYSFNNTINGFTALEGEGVQRDMTQSFRVSAPIAKRIQTFVNLSLVPNFKFTGRDYGEDVTIKSSAFISRYNSGLLDKMFELMEDGTCFKTTRPITTILELPLILANLNEHTTIKDYNYKHIEKLRASWAKSPTLQKRNSLCSHVVDGLKEDGEVTMAYKVILKHGAASLNKLVRYVKSTPATDCTIVLTTAHSSKGLEFASVEIGDDLNASALKATKDLKKWNTKFNTRTPEEADLDLKDKFEEEMRLYYVATSRAMVELTNAQLM